jgi:hypothetical protein
VPGTSSEDQHEQDQPETLAAAKAVHQRTRITNLYATPWHLTGGATAGEIPDYLQLWRFESYYRLSASQFPGVLSREALDPCTLKFQRWRHAACLAGARIWLFCLPSGQIVAALSLDVGCGLADTIDLLEDCYFADVHIGAATAEEYAHALAAQLGANGSTEREFLPERHQIVYGQTPAVERCEDVVQRLIYRSDLDYRKEYSLIRYPAELNRRRGWLAAVGPYVSVACGHPGFIENALFLSAVQAVAAAAQLRAIRHAAYEDVRLFRSFESAGGSTRARRRTLEGIADQLGDLELELSYSVEASADLGLILPSLRVESFHHALYESMGLASKAVTAGRMLERLGSAIRAELTAIESIERRADDNRRVRYAVAVGFVSVVAIPASLILAYLGINASQVHPDQSMFSHRYLGMYLTVAAVIVLGVLLSVGLYVQQRRQARHYRSLEQRPRWTLSPEEPPSSS